VSSYFRCWRDVNWLCRCRLVFDIWLWSLIYTFCRRCDVTVGKLTPDIIVDSDVFVGFGNVTCLTGNTIRNVVHMC